MRRKERGAFKRFMAKLHNPPNWVAVITIATTLVVCPLVALSLFLDYGHALYAFFAITVCLLLVVYTIVVIVNSIVKMRRKVIKVADRYEFTRKLHRNFEFRTLVFGVCSLLCNVGYTVFLIVMAFRYRSVWYGAIGVYYILLSVSRGGVLIQNRKDERRFRFDYQRLERAKVGTYRYCGIMMLTLALALLVSVIELVVDGSGFRHAVWLIYVFASVAAYKVVMAIVNFVRATKRDDLVVRSVRYINLAVALMSVLCLQTAVLAASGLSPITVAVWNGVTGGIACAITLSLGLFMVLFSVKEKARLLEREAIYAEGMEFLERGYNRDGYGEEYKEEK